MSDHYDVAIVGLGIVGSAILARLSSSSRAVGIDRFMPPHVAGSSHGENRIIRGAPGEGAVYAELAARAFALFDDLARRTGRTLLHMTGGFDSSTPPSGWAEKARDIARDHRLPFEAIAGSALKARYGNFALPDEAQVILQPRFGHVAAELTWQAFLDVARADGAEFRFGQAVASIHFGDPNLVTFDDGTSLSCTNLVLAAGSWLNELLDFRLKLRVERRVLAWYAVEQPRGPILPFCFVDGPNDGFWYGMPARAGTAIKIGAHHHFREEVSPDSVPPVNGADLALLNGFIARNMNGIAARPLASATCKYTLTGTEDFIIDRHPRHANVLIFSCCSGHGFKYAPVYGEIAEAMLQGRDYAIDLAQFAIAPHIDA